MRQYTYSMLRAVLCIAVIAGLLSVCSCNTVGGQPGDASVPIEERFPIDGVIDFSKLNNIQENELTFIQIPGLTPAHTTQVTWAVMNDDKNIYIAVQWTDDDHNSDFSLTAGPLDYDSINLLFDNNGNGAYENGENRFYALAASESSIAVDAKKSTYESDAVGNGYGYLKYHEDRKIYQAEFLLPLEGDSTAESITKNTKMNFTISDHVVNNGVAPDPDSGFFTMLVFEDDNSTNWPLVPITDADPITREPIPGDLDGLIVFTSTRDHPKGEIYSFNPRTRDVVRLTNNNQYEGTISLSHDRTRIAFMGSSGNPEKDLSYAAECEIYIVTIANGTIEKLTDNAFLDGHPGWSPDDTKIVYGCYNPANRGAHIILADLSLASGDPGKFKDITLLSDPSANSYWCDEMDPDFTPNGNIVFKTNRYAQADYFSAQGHYFNYGDSSMLHVALMNTDGSDSMRITRKPDVVDHDPISNAEGTFAAFERILGDYDYLSIPGCFGPWDIVEVKLDGSAGEKTLVHDPWVNWLPVYDPSGKYIVYFRSCGYTETRLVRRSDNKDLGRFIPGVTSFNYLDWK